MVAISKASVVSQRFFVVTDRNAASLLRSYARYGPKPHEKPRKPQVAVSGVIDGVARAIADVSRALLIQLLLDRLSRGSRSERAPQSEGTFRTSSPITIAIVDNRTIARVSRLD